MAYDHEVILNFYDSLWEIIRDVTGLNANATRTAPLYHYTDAKGYHGILTSKQLWMTNDEDARDALELRYGSRKFMEAISSAGLDKATISRQVDPYAHQPPDYPAVYGVYMTSFSEDGDEPHHWQNFGNQGRGFSMGFDFSKGMEPWTVQNAPERILRFGKVIYDEDLLDDVLVQLLKYTVDAEKNKRHGDTKYRQILRHVLAEMLPFFKHDSFQQEKEWRIIATRLAGHTPEQAYIQPHGDGLRSVLPLKSTGRQNLPAINHVITGPRVTESNIREAQGLLWRAHRGLRFTSREASMSSSRWA